jgi:hypothetical protein
MLREKSKEKRAKRDTCTKKYPEKLKKSNLPRQISALRRPPEISKKRHTEGDKYAKPTPREKQKETSNET